MKTQIRFCIKCGVYEYHDITTSNEADPTSLIGRLLLGVLTAGVSEMSREEMAVCQRCGKKTIL